VLFTTLKNTVVGLAFLVVLAVTTLSRQSPPSRLMTRRDWLGLAVIAVIGGSVPFLLFFTGLKLASAPSAALIHKTLFIWVALLAVPLLGEGLGKWVVAGLGVLLVGQLFSNFPKAWGWGLGENLIVIATLFWSCETILVKRLLPNVPVVLAATARMAGGAVVMWSYLAFMNQMGNVFALTSNQWMWVLITSVFLFGYVTTWYSALKFAPATVVTSVLTVGAVITVGVTALVGGKLIDTIPALGLIFTLIGAALVAGLWIEQRKHVRLATA
jgi:drug/metabolite transporter (DMT)-like permease